MVPSPRAYARSYELLEKNRVKQALPSNQVGVISDAPAPRMHGASPPAFASIDVQGAGTSSANGIYTRIQQKCNGTDVFRQEGTNLAVLKRGNCWYITDLGNPFRLQSLRAVDLYRVTCFEDSVTPPALGWTVKDAKQPAPYVEVVPLREAKAGSTLRASQRLLKTSSTPQLELKPASNKIPDKGLDLGARVAAAELRLKQAQKALPVGASSKRGATRGRADLGSGKSSAKIGNGVFFRFFRVFLSPPSNFRRKWGFHWQTEPFREFGDRHLESIGEDSPLAKWNAWQRIRGRPELCLKNGDRLVRADGNRPFCETEVGTSIQPGKPLCLEFARRELRPLAPAPPTLRAGPLKDTKGKLELGNYLSIQWEPAERVTHTLGWALFLMDVALEQWFVVESADGKTDAVKPLKIGATVVALPGDVYSSTVFEGLLPGRAYAASVAIITELGWSPLSNVSDPLVLPKQMRLSEQVLPKQKGREMPPKKKLQQDSDSDNDSEEEEIPAGFRGAFVTLEIAKAEQLIALDTGLLKKGASDPYMKVLVNGQKQVHKTATKSSTLEPVWNEKCDFYVSPEETMLSLQLWDYDRVGDHDSMGRITIDLEKYTEEASWKPKWINVQPDDDCPNATGKVLLTLSVKQNEFYKHEGGKGTLHIVNADGLIATDSSFTGKGTSDPYIKVLVDGWRQIHQTTVKDNTLSPTWNEKVEFDLSPQETTLVFEFFDKDIDADDPMGRAVFNVVGTEIKKPEIQLKVQPQQACLKAQGKLGIVMNYEPRKPPPKKEKKIEGVLEYVPPAKIKPGFTAPVSLSVARNDDHLMARPKRFQFTVTLQGGDRRYGLRIGEAAKNQKYLRVVDVYDSFDICPDCRNALEWKQEGRWICKNEFRCGSSSSTLGQGRMSCNVCVNDFCPDCCHKEATSVGTWNREEGAGYELHGVTVTKAVQLHDRILRVNDLDDPAEILVEVSRAPESLVILVERGDRSAKLFVIDDHLDLPMAHLAEEVEQNDLVSTFEGEMISAMLGRDSSRLEQTIQLAYGIELHQRCYPTAIQEAERRLGSMKKIEAAQQSGNAEDERTHSLKLAEAMADIAQDPEKLREAMAIFEAGMNALPSRSLIAARLQSRAQALFQQWSFRRRCEAADVELAAAEAEAKGWQEGKQPPPFELGRLRQALEEAENCNRKGEVYIEASEVLVRLEGVNTRDAAVKRILMAMNHHSEDEKALEAALDGGAAVECDKKTIEKGWRKLRMWRKQHTLDAAHAELRLTLKNLEPLIGDQVRHIPGAGSKEQKLVRLALEKVIHLDGEEKLIAETQRMLLAWQMDKATLRTEISLSSAIGYAEEGYQADHPNAGEELLMAVEEAELNAVSVEQVEKGKTVLNSWIASRREQAQQKLNEVMRYDDDLEVEKAVVFARTAGIEEWQLEDASAYALRLQHQNQVGKLLKRAIEQADATKLGICIAKAHHVKMTNEENPVLNMASLKLRVLVEGEDLERTIKARDVEAIEGEIKDSAPLLRDLESFPKHIMTELGVSLEGEARAVRNSLYAAQDLAAVLRAEEALQEALILENRDEDLTGKLADAVPLLKKGLNSELVEEAKEILGTMKVNRERLTTCLSEEDTATDFLKNSIISAAAVGVQGTIIEKARHKLKSRGEQVWDRFSVESELLEAIRFHANFKEPVGKRFLRLEDALLATEKLTIRLGAERLRDGNEARVVLAAEQAVVTAAKNARPVLKKLQSGASELLSNVSKVESALKEARKHGLPESCPAMVEAKTLADTLVKEVSIRHEAEYALVNGMASGDMYDLRDGLINARVSKVLEEQLAKARKQLRELQRSELQRHLQNAIRRNDKLGVDLLAFRCHLLDFEGADVDECNQILKEVNRVECRSSFSQKRDGAGRDCLGWRHSPQFMVQRLPGCEEEIKVEVLMVELEDSLETHGMHVVQNSSTAAAIGCHSVEPGFQELASCDYSEDQSRLEFKMPHHEDQRPIFIVSSIVAPQDGEFAVVVHSSHKMLVTEVTDEQRGDLWKFEQTFNLDWSVLHNTAGGGRRADHAPKPSWYQNNQLRISVRDSGNGTPAQCILCALLKRKGAPPEDGWPPASIHILRNKLNPKYNSNNKLLENARHHDILKGGCPSNPEYPNESEVGIICALSSEGDNRPFFLVTSLQEENREGEFELTLLSTEPITAEIVDRRSFDDRGHIYEHKRVSVSDAPPPAALVKRQETASCIDLTQRSLNQDEITKAVSDPNFVKDEMRKAKGKDIYDPVVHKRVVAIAAAGVKRCGKQHQLHGDTAKKAYEQECQSFAERHPRAAKSYAKIAATAQDMEKHKAVAFYVGFVEGLAATELNPEELVEKVGTDWNSLKQAMHNFVTNDAVTANNGTFEDDDDSESHKGFVSGMIHEVHVFEHKVSNWVGQEKARAEAFATSLKPVISSILKTLKDLNEIITEIAGPLMLVSHIIDMCTPPFIALITQVVKDGYHLAHKSDREADVAAIHFLQASWQHLPCSHEQWHDIGHNLGIVVLAFTGV